MFLGACLEGALVAQAIAPRTFHAVAGEFRTATLRDGVPSMTAITSTRTTPLLEFPIRVLTTAAPEPPGLKLVIPPATPPGDYTIEVTGRGRDGRSISTTLQMKVEAVTLSAATVAVRPPVVLLNGFQLVCGDTASTLAASVDTFGQLASLLQADGVGVAYFNNCTYGDISIEQLAGQLNIYLAGLHYTDGTPITQVDLVVHSMGGLIARAYLAGKGQTSGVFSPPANPRVRKLVTIATPHFGSFQAADIGTQESEMALGNPFLWDLATWNQGHDDLRGVDALAIIGNAGTNNASDGVVSLTSASLGFVQPDQRTRIVPYCHVTPGPLTGLGMNCSNHQGIADIDSASHLSAQIVRSFLADTSDWMSIGTTPNADPWLSQYGGVYFAVQGTTGQYMNDLTQVAFGSTTLLNGASPSVFYEDFVRGTGTFEAMSLSLGQISYGPATVPTGHFVVMRAKLAPEIFSVTPLLPSVSLLVESGEAITISGSGFGQQQCSTCAVWAYPGPASLQVLSWSDQAITVNLPSSSGFVQLVVQTASGSDEINIMTTGLSSAGSMAQVASGGGWDTTLTLVNLGTATAEARLNFYANDGSTPLLPFTFPQQPSQGTILGSTYDETLGAGATLVLDTTGPATQTTVTGWSELLTSGSIGGFAIFKYTPTGQEAVVPLETRNAGSYVLAFDNTGKLATGLAIANLAASSANAGVILRNDLGVQIGTGSIGLPAQGHNSFMLTDATYGFPITANKRGTVEFDTPQGGQISVLGLRANGAALTSLPLLANVGTTGGTMAHVACGGGWQTIFTLVNTGAAPANATLKFFADDGSALSLPLKFPQTGTTATESSVSEAVPAGATLVILTQGQNSGNSVTGSGQLTTNGRVSGFAIFQNTAAGQEAVVPLEVGSANSYTLAFDNTGSLATGIALSNGSGQSATVPATLRDSTGATLATTTINLPASGHTSEMLTDLFGAAANIRGTLEFDAPSGGQIAALGIRATPAGVFTTIPVMTK